MKLSFTAVVEYVKELVPAFGPLPISSESPFEDAEVLAHISGGRAFHLTANNGRSYLYIFPRGEENMRLAKYILRSNGLRPRLHMSRYYYNKTPVLRVPYSEFSNSPERNSFVDNVLSVSVVDLKKDRVETRVKILQQKLQQKTK